LAILSVLTLLLPLFTLGAPQARADRPARIAAVTVASARVADAESSANIRINEVMPKPEVGAFEWVELYRPNIFLVYLPLGSQECRWLYDRCSPSRLPAGPMSPTQWSV
jgi:hypothetical protein